MSMWARSRAEPEAAIEEVWQRVDPRLAPQLRREWLRARHSTPPLQVSASAQVVLAGHRASGKSRVLEPIAALLGRPALDLDAELRRHVDRPLGPWVARDLASFRAAERQAFARLPPGLVVAVGGGFLSLHPDLLEGHLVVEIPIGFETYRERLLADRERPRLRPELALEEEIAQVFAERERLHARVQRLSLPEFLAGLVAP